MSTWKWIKSKQEDPISSPDPQADVAAQGWRTILKHALEDVKNSPGDDSIRESGFQLDDLLPPEAFAKRMLPLVMAPVAGHKIARKKWWSENADKLREHLVGWQLGTKRKSRDALAEIPPLPKEARLEMLRRVAARTRTRVNPTTGTREYELFRGRHPGMPISLENTGSWTPDTNIAAVFSGNNPKWFNQAWIPEEHISLYLPYLGDAFQNMRPNQFDHEREVIVKQLWPSAIQRQAAHPLELKPVVPSSDQIVNKLGSMRQIERESLLPEILKSKRNPRKIKFSGFSPWKVKPLSENPFELDDALSRAVEQWHGDRDFAPSILIKLPKKE